MPVQSADVKGSEKFDVARLKVRSIDTNPRQFYFVYNCLQREVFRSIQF